jgi:hypothetical protein
MNPDTNRLDPGFDPRIADWLESDPDRAPSEVVDTILAALPSVPQRRPFSVPWRLPNMFTNRVALAAIAIILVVAGGGYAWSRFGGTGDVGGIMPSTASPTPVTTPTPTPTASPSPSPTPVPTLTASYVGTTLNAGTYRVDGFAVPFKLTLPASWIAQEFTRNNLVLRSENDFLTLVVMDAVYRDPCHLRTAASPLAPGVDALITAFGSMAGFRISDVKDRAIGGADGKAFTLSNSYHPSSDGCSDPNVLTIGTYDKDGSEARQIIGANEADSLYAVDVAGKTILIGGPATIVDTLSFEGASPS